MAMTLAQLAQLETGPTFKNYIITNLIRMNPLMQTVPFENVNSLRTVAIRWRTLPTVAFRQINAAYTANEGQFEQVWESVYGFGGEMQFDRVFNYLTNTVQDPKRAIVDQKLAAMKIAFNNYLINGDHGVDPDGVVGLRVRLASYPARQTVRFAGTGAAAALDPTASVANGNLFWTHLEELHEYCNDGGTAFWLMNLATYLGVGRVIRFIQASAGNWIGVQKDVFGKKDIPTLFGAPVYDPGLLNDQTTEIIADEADDAATATNATRIFAVSTDSMQGFTGIQLNDMTPYDPQNGGEMETAPATLTRIDWWIGFTGFGSYGLTQGRNLEPTTAWTA